MGESEQATPQLIEAVRAGSEEAVRAALAGGGDVHARDGDGWSALDWAAGSGNEVIVQVLLEGGADPLSAGHEQRTAYEIALAAGHLAAARILRAAEESADPARAAARTWTPYCRAYRLEDLRAFEGWREPAEELGGEEVVFVHDDFTVTATMWPGEDVVFDDVSPAWKAFCEQQLDFKPPDDFDLVPPETSSA